MASLDAAAAPDQISSAIVAFAAEGQFPESEDVATLPLSSESLPAAIEARGKTRSDLEVRIASTEAFGELFLLTWAV